MEILFYKYHGTGNDFILIDNRLHNWHPTPQQAAFLCDRHRGIGADGLMLLSEMAGYDFGMSYYNSDGNESTMCGNGGRCIAAFARRLGLTDKTSHFHASDGAHEVVILSETRHGFNVRLKMRDTKIGKEYPEGIFIDTGSPHLVLFTDDVKSVDVVGQGRKLRFDERFLPGGTNVDFVEQNGNGIFVRSYERGVEDETLSCGTGVTASAMAFSHKRAGQADKIAIATPGGNLTVSFHRENERFSDVWLEGPATFVFSGKVMID